MIDDFIGYRFFRVDEHSSFYGKDVQTILKDTGSIIYKKGEKIYIKIPHFLDENKNIYLSESLTELNVVQFTHEVRSLLQ